jgi:hypothetical protein
LGKEWNITKEKIDKEGRRFAGAAYSYLNIKRWLIVVHHKCAPPDQQYLDEYHFQFNRRGFLISIFDKLITKMTQAKPVNYKMIKCELNT